MTPGTAAAGDREPLLIVRDLTKLFPRYRPWLLGFARRPTGVIRAVDGVSFDVRRGETLGLVGESGCGKTTTARLILRVLRPTQGEILFRTPEGLVPLHALAGEALRTLRRHIQLIFQDPYSSLNPRMPVGESIAEPLRLQGWGTRAEIAERTRALMAMVGLDAQQLHRYPHAFSGGQRQRIGIARALALHPDLVVCDEPVSALDVSVQAQVLNLLKDLQAQLGLTYLFISHNLAVVAYMANRIAVMYAGRIVELAATREIFERPRHPYTETLLSAILRPDPAIRPASPAPARDGGDAPAPHGCPFAPQCGYAVGRCRAECPELVAAGPDHLARCHRAREIQLAPLARRVPDSAGPRAR